jgi:hypothetical protein
VLKSKTSKFIKLNKKHSEYNFLKKKNRQKIKFLAHSGGSKLTKLFFISFSATMGQNYVKFGSKSVKMTNLFRKSLKSITMGRFSQKVSEQRI